MDALSSIFDSLNRPPLEFLSPEESRRASSFIKKKRWADAMKRSPTKAESIVWAEIKRLRRKNVKLARQYVIHGFIADFCCLKHKLVIEIDGSSHKGREDYDRMRDAALKKHGWRTIRFTNQQVESDLNAVVKKIRTALGFGPLRSFHVSTKTKGDKGRTAFDRFCERQKRYEMRMKMEREAY